MTDIQQTAKSIRKMVIGAIVVEYAMLEIKDQTKQDLKARANNLIKASKSVQNWFLFHPQSTDTHREVFKKEFLKSEIYLLSELLELVWGVGEEDLENIISELKKCIVDQP